MAASEHQAAGGRPDHYESRRVPGLWLAFAPDLTVEERQAAWLERLRARTAANLAAQAAAHADGLRGYRPAAIGPTPMAAGGLAVWLRNEVARREAKANGHAKGKKPLSDAAPSAAVLRAKRERLGVSQAQVALRAGISRSGLADMEVPHQRKGAVKGGGHGSEQYRRKVAAALDAIEGQQQREALASQAAAAGVSPSLTDAYVGGTLPPEVMRLMGERLAKAASRC